MNRIGRRQPHQILLCLWCTIAALVFFAGVAPVPGSISAILPGIVLTVWNSLLLAGGVVGLVGSLWPRSGIYTGLQLERASMIFLSAGTVMYVISMIEFAGWRAVGAIGFLAAWGGACVWRALQIHSDIKTLTRSGVP